MWLSRSFMMRSCFLFILFSSNAPLALITCTHHTWCLQVTFGLSRYSKSHPPWGFLCHSSNYFSCFHFHGIFSFEILQRWEVPGMEYIKWNMFSKIKPVDSLIYFMELFQIEEVQSCWSQELFFFFLFYPPLDKCGLRVYYTVIKQTIYNSI